MATTAVPRTAVTPLLARNKVGLVILGVLGLVDVLSLAAPSTPDDQAGPPTSILVLDTVLGLVTLVFVVVAFRTRSRGAVRIVAGARILSVLTAVPAFFADGVPAGLVAAAAAVVVVTFVGIVLALTPARRTQPVLD